MEILIRLRCFLCLKRRGGRQCHQQGENTAEVFHTSIEIKDLLLLAFNQFLHKGLGTVLAIEEEGIIGAPTDGETVLP